MTPRTLNLQEMESDLNSKMMNFNIGFTSYWTCLEFRKFEKITIPWIALFTFRIQPTPHASVDFIKLPRHLEIVKVSSKNVEHTNRKRMEMVLLNKVKVPQNLSRSKIPEIETKFY